MIRTALRTAALIVAAASLFACTADTTTESVDQREGALAGGAIDGAGTCDADDPGCADVPPCPADAPDCGKAPPCPADAPDCGKAPPCPADAPDCGKAPPPCPDGTPDCGKVPPCPDDDPDCAKVPPTPSYDCAKGAKELAGLLAAAQACNVASMGMKAQCATFVPTTSGCDAPVATPDGDATVKYLGAWKLYASHCPLPLPACPDPKLLTTECVQDPNVDSLVGACAVVAESPSVDDAAD